MSYNVLKGIAEYIQELAGESETLVAFTLSDFVDYTGVNPIDRDGFLLLTLKCIGLMAQFLCLNDTCGLYSLVEFVQYDNGNNVSIKFHEQTIKTRKENQNWLVDYAGDYEFEIKRMKEMFK